MKYHTLCSSRPRLCFITKTVNILLQTQFSDIGTISAHSTDPTSAPLDMCKQCFLKNLDMCTAQCEKTFQRLCQTKSINHIAFQQAALPCLQPATMQGGVNGKMQISHKIWLHQCFGDFKVAIVGNSVRQENASLIPVLSQQQELHHSIRYDENFHHEPHHTCCAPIKAP